jgi:hypothetical protein
VDASLADTICCFNRHAAERSGYWLTTKCLKEAGGTEVSFYDSVSRKLLFVAPRGRSFKEWEKEPGARLALLPGRGGGVGRCARAAVHGRVRVVGGDASGAQPAGQEGQPVLYQPSQHRRGAAWLLGWIVMEAIDRDDGGPTTARTPTTRRAPRAPRGLDCREADSGWVCVRRPSKVRILRSAGLGGRGATRNLSGGVLDTPSPACAFSSALWVAGKHELTRSPAGDRERGAHGGTFRLLFSWSSRSSLPHIFSFQPFISGSYLWDAFMCLLQCSSPL